MDARHRWFAVDLEKATLVYSDQPGAALKRCAAPGAAADTPGEILVSAAPPPLTVAVEAFVAAVRRGDACAESFALGCAVVETLAAAARALR